MSRRRLKSRGGAESLVLDVLGDLLGRNVLNVGLAGIQFVDLSGVGIEPCDRLANISKSKRQRQDPRNRNR